MEHVEGVEERFEFGSRPGWIEASIAPAAQAGTDIRGLFTHLQVRHFKHLLGIKPLIRNNVTCTLHNYRSRLAEELIFY